MKWSNLKKNKCPKCDKDFMDSLIPNPFMFEHACGFKIRESKYRQIVASQINDNIERQLTEQYIKEGGDN